MPAFKITLVGLLYFFASLALDCNWLLGGSDNSNKHLPGVSLILCKGSKCPQDAISKLVVCYYKGEVPLTNFNTCNCTHVVFTNGVKRAENNSIIPTEDTIKYLDVIKEKKENLSAIFTLETKQDDTSAILKSENRTEQLINAIAEFLQESQFDGIELNFKFSSDDGVSRESYGSFVKKLSKTLSHHRRVKREGYDVFEKLQDDITTASYTTQTPRNSTSKTQSIKESSEESSENNRKIREQKNEEEDDKDYLTLEEAINAEFSNGNSESQVTLKDVEEDMVDEKFLIFVRLSIKPEIIAKKYDLKALSRYADVLSVPTHDIVNTTEEHLTYHPSRLMGLSDILNTDSILDFLTGMGALKSKMVISLPATVLKFELKDENKNTPRSPSRSKPQVIDQLQLCSLFNKNNWTVERDDDLTAPYAFSGKTWLAFEDEISINIKGKYILLRELAGGAIYPIDSDQNDGSCKNHTGSNGYLTGILHKNFEKLERKPRALVLESLQDEIHENAFTNVEGGVKLSEYRIVRVVDHSGAVHIIRKNTKTQFECSRQGYFSHPLGCNKFYRCVKFDQYSDEFTVFEYDCPAGLAFDERWEVCVWPGSLPHGAPCTGSSEIAPVPRSHYQCPNHEGYYADPENCRWFFACLDHARDGITPLTAYEFRCPFGLVFSETKLACDWPWLVGACGNRGAAGYLQVSAAGQSQGIHTATFINGGNLEASLGQYGKTDEEASFIGFGKKFGSGLKGSGGYNAEASYQGAQSAGFGYIAGQTDDHHDRASFAAFPDYEISGGRILNKGGVVLNQNIAGVSGVGTGGAFGSTGSTFGHGRALGGVGSSSATGAAFGSVGNTVSPGGAFGKVASTVGHGVAFGGVGSTVSPGGAFGSVGSTVDHGVAFGSVGSTVSPGGAFGSVGSTIGHGAAFGSVGNTVSPGGAFGSLGSTVDHGVAFGSVGSTVSPGGAFGSVGSTVDHGAAFGSVGSTVSPGGAFGGVGSTVGHGRVLGSVGGTSDAGVAFGSVGSTVGNGGVLGGALGISENVAGGFGSTSRGFSKSSGYFNSVSTPKPKFERPALKASKTNTLDISGISSGGQVSLQNSISTPKPFSVGIPSVQINEEKISEFSSHSTIGSTTPQNLVLKETPQTENIRVSGHQFSISHGFAPSQPTVPVGVNVITPTTETYAHGRISSEGLGTSHLGADVSVNGVSVTPATEVHRFGQFKQNEFQNKISVNQGSVTVGVPAYTGTSSGYSSTVSGGTTPSGSVSFSVPSVTPKPALQTFGYTASHGVGVDSESSFVGFTQQDYKLTDQAGSVKTLEGAVPAIQANIFKNTNEGQNFVSGNFGQAGVSFGAPLSPVTPSYSGVKTGSASVIHLSEVSKGPTVTNFVKSAIDEKVSNELKFNKPQISYSVPTVTPKPELHSFSKVPSGQLNSHFVSSNIPVVTPKPNYQVFSQAGLTGKSQASVSYSVPVAPTQSVTSDLNSLKYYDGSVGVTPVVPFESSATIRNGFDQRENTDGISKVAFNVVPASVQFEKTSTFQQKGISQGGKTSYNIPFATSDVQTDTVVQTGISHTPQIIVPDQPSFGQRYTTFKQSGNSFGQIQPFGSTPKVQQTNILTGVSTEQHQPFVSVGTIGSSNTDKILSTPRTHSSSQDVFLQSPPTQNINFKSTYVQPQPVTVTTPAPVVSITPSTPVTPHSFNLNVIAKTPQTINYKQQETINVGPSTPTTTVHGSGAVIFGEKSSGFKQDIKTFTPVVQVSTPAPVTYKQDISSGISGKSFFEKGYLSPVTPKAEVFGTTIQHNQGTRVEFGTAGGNQILIQAKQPIINQNFDFIKTQSFNEQKRTEFIQPQVPLQVSTPAPEFQQKVKIEQPVVTTGEHEPRERLVELEISKSIELNPTQFTQSNGYLSRNFPGQEVEIQQQPVHLISQKSFTTKQVIQPFYKQEKEVVHSQVNNIPENRYQEEFAFQQPVNIKTPKPEVQYLPGTTVPSVSYNTVKTVKIEQPVIYSKEPAPALPIFEPSRVHFKNQKETITSNTNVYQPAFVDQEPSKVNLLLPTEAPQFVTSQTEEYTIQTHRNFDSQKISKFGSTPVQNVFVQSTLKPAISVYETANLTNGQFGFGIKYPTNPNIEIPEPPREYVLAQNAYTTVAPEVITTGGQFPSTESLRTGYKSSTYLPPSREKSSKTTVISVGTLDEEDSDGNVHQLFNKYAGRFGEVINGKAGNLVTKLIKGDGRGTIEVDKQGSSTVQYEVSSTTPRPRGRGRQYHGVITSGVQATNKYEEYEIDGGGQRSFGGKDNGEFSKTTIDLKNLKLDKNKKTVIVVSQVSDANPILVGKLAGQCSCQSNMLELRGKGKNSKGRLRGKNQSDQQRPFYITNEYLPPFEGNPGNSAEESLTQGQQSTAAPGTVFIDGSKQQHVSYSTEQTLVSSTTAQPEIVPSTILSSLGPEGVLSITPKTIYSDERRNKKTQFRGRARYLPPTASLTADGLPLLSPVRASEIASTLDSNGLKGDESRTQNEIDGVSKAFAGAAYERYGPGGWRSFDETLQGSIDCKRPGLFRHPRYCNKFYACNYDQWEERYTLHIFNCPIHLAYDSSISACNWPVRGPACADDNLLV